MNYPAPETTDLRFTEDLVVGTEYDLGNYLVTATEIMAFARRWDPLGIHTDPSLASASHFGAVIASGVYTLAVFQRLAVAGVLAHWHVVAGRTLREVQFLAPVHADTHLHGSLTVTAVSKGHHRWGLVTTSGTLKGRDTGPVLSLEMDAYVRRRPTAC